MLIEEPRSVGAALPAQLAAVLACPACHSTLQRLRCSSCGWAGVEAAFGPDCADGVGLSDAERAELAAQSAAVGEYYENEEKLSCHWDRLSAADLPELAGVRGGVVLDLGCGTGSAGAAFKRAGATVVGADLSPACAAVASRRLDAVVRCHSSRLPFRDESFDAVVARGALHHMQHPERAVAEVRRVLRRGGVFLALDPREFAWLEPLKGAIRRGDASFTDDHHAYGVSEYADLIGQQLDVEHVQTFHPFAILVAVGLDLFPLPRQLPKRGFARMLLGVDQRLNKTPLARLGHLVAVRARKPA